MSDELILAISGNDIFSGGGLHADLATFTTNKQHGFVALTCLTAMTENGFEVIPVDTNVFKQQLDSLKDIPFSAIKIGLLPNVEIAELTLDFVKKHSDIPIVLDPVLSSCYIQFLLQGFLLCILPFLLLFPKRDRKSTRLNSSHLV